ncbi:D-3-phosphoglycerate dehydrogenase [Caballeronia glathei]|uniref:2-hydroxyacid dehydrogenase n=1 Tax=Caballeronia glathei TaxID=60547 RepID=A0A069PQS5_9BURK|nr:NAD(P)-dependent oxidoreductase [Caballeronia glathei]KDR42792.1 2-hydroxyacid dehydrogenase [Caballeronia glathei]CDY78988.1 D-3-phosphoglycerate dehydrogenase [Caballeronia glathei]
MTKIYLTHTPEALKNYYGERALAQLRALGEVTLNNHDRVLTLDEFVNEVRDHEIVVASRDAAAPAGLFERSPGLVAFCRVAVDIRNIDVDAANRHGVLVTRATPGFDTSVAEWIVGVMIDLSRGVSSAAAAYWQQRTPSIAMGRELRASTLGIIGYGFIGRRLAVLARALGMGIVVCDPFASIAEPDVHRRSFEEVLECADYVICLAPAIPETADLFGRAAFARMRREAYFINASRGELVDESALLDALDNDVIAGAALDVGRAADQMPSPMLAAHPKVVASPHVGGLTPPAIEHQAMDTVRQVKALLDGTMPENAVNPGYATRLARLPGFSGAFEGART